jgi:hypothetical protein
LLEFKKMKRRTFGLLASGSLLAVNAGRARAQSATPDASQLGTTLTPIGGEIAGNADGSIPAWTGGLTTLPSGVEPNEYVPELFPNEQPLLVIDSSNVADHASMLSIGAVAMMSKYPDFKVKVYPTHRTAAAPQTVYDRIKANVATAKFVDQDPVRGRFGFEGAFGGVPFPIPDTSNPLTAGAQIIWNYNAVWNGAASSRRNQAWSVSSGHLSMAQADNEDVRFPYYIAQSLDEYTGKYQSILFQISSPYYAPAALVGQNIIVWNFSNPYKNPAEAWELLNGQGRVRRAPEVSFDTPDTQANGICGYDENFGFTGSLERYDWKLLGKREMYIPYNCNGLFAAAPEQAHLTHFVNPELVRWEKHRCWVVEATLHPGERNVLARRRLYVDEDSWQVALIDAWDGNDNLFKTAYLYNTCQPGLPGVVFGNVANHNLQTSDYVTISGQWNKDPIKYVDDISASVFDPSNMAASAQY